MSIWSQFIGNKIFDALLKILDKLIDATNVTKWWSLILTSRVRQISLFLFFCLFLEDQQTVTGDISALHLRNKSEMKIDILVPYLSVLT